MSKPLINFFFMNLKIYNNTKNFMCKIVAKLNIFPIPAKKKFIFLSKIPKKSDFSLHFSAKRRFIVLFQAWEGVAAQDFQAACADAYFRAERLPTGRQGPPAGFPQGH